MIGAGTTIAGGVGVATAAAGSTSVWEGSMYSRVVVAPDAALTWSRSGSRWSWTRWSRWRAPRRPARRGRSSPGTRRRQRRAVLRHGEADDRAVILRRARQRHVHELAARVVVGVGDVHLARIEPRGRRVVAEQVQRLTRPVDVGGARVAGGELKLTGSPPAVSVVGRSPVMNGLLVACGALVDLATTACPLSKSVATTSQTRCRWRPCRSRTPDRRRRSSRRSPGHRRPRRPRACRTRCRRRNRCRRPCRRHGP